MRKCLKTVAVSIALALLAGCASSGQLDKMDNPRSAMIYGSVQAAQPIVAVSIRRNIKFGTGDPNAYTRVYPNGLFVADNVPPGDYWLDSMGTNDKTYSFLSLKDNFNPAAFHRHLFHVKPGQMVYLGSFRLDVVKAVTKNSNGKVKLVRVSRPGEKSVLTGLLPHAKESGWDARIQSRIARLR